MTGTGAGVSNFILQPGTMSRDEIVKNTKRGLYVTHMMGFGFNAVTGDFSRGASGFWIEDGAFAYPVSEVTISLNFDRLWQTIDAVGSDLDLKSSVAAPTFRVADPLRDEELNLIAREVADDMLTRDPELTLPEHAGLRHALGTRDARSLELFRVG